MNRQTRAKLLLTCSLCGKEFVKDKKEFDRRTKNGHTKFFCTRSCSASAGHITSPRKGCPEHLPRKRKDEYSPFRWFMSRARFRDKQDNLTLPDIKNQWDKQNGKCVYLNISLELSRDCNDDRIKASLDRIDSNKPYSVDNIQFVSVALNYCKNSMSDSNFREFLQLIKDNY